MHLKKINIDSNWQNMDWRKLTEQEKTVKHINPPPKKWGGTKNRRDVKN